MDDLMRAANWTDEDTIRPETVNDWERRMDRAQEAAEAAQATANSAIPYSEKGALSGVAALDGGACLAQTHPPKLYVYVDAVNGVDAPGRGSRSEPLRTFAYAVQLTRHAEVATIELSEGLHIVNTEIPVINRILTVHGVGFNSRLRISERRIVLYNATFGFQSITLEIDAGNIHANGLCHVSIGGYSGALIKNVSGVNRAAIISEAITPSYFGGNVITECGSFLFVNVGRSMLQSDAGRLALIADRVPYYANNISLYRSWETTIGANCRVADKVEQIGTAQAYLAQGVI